MARVWVDSLGQRRRTVDVIGLTPTLSSDEALAWLELSVRQALAACHFWPGDVRGQCYPRSGAVLGRGSAAVVDV